MSKAKGFHKKPSKRIPAKRRYRIEKKVREHNKKMKKLTKMKEQAGGGKKKQLISMPRSAPFSLEGWDGLTASSSKSSSQPRLVTEFSSQVDLETKDKLVEQPPQTNSLISQKINQRVKDLHSKNQKQAVGGDVDETMELDEVVNDNSKTSSPGKKKTRGRKKKAGKTTEISEGEKYDFDNDFE